MHQVTLNMLVTKYLDNNIFDHMDTWGETLASTSWEIRASYHCTIMATPDQAIFGREMLFNLVVAVNWRALPAANQRQVDIDNII